MVKGKTTRSKTAKKTAKKPAARARASNTLAIDIGGSGLKATVLGPRGRMLVDRVRIETPVGASPSKIVELLAKLVKPLPPFKRASVGFPGVVRDGIIRTAPNLDHHGWSGFDLAAALRQRLRVPVRIANDADIQGLAVIAGTGVEMVITLGTGFGTALFADGRLAPHLELAHHRFRGRQTYDEQLGDEARRKAGKKTWNRRLAKAIANLRVLVNFDRLHIGGGNARHVTLKLADDIAIVSNRAGLLGGIKLWQV